MRGCFALLAVCFAPVAVIAQTPERYTLSGQVVDSATGKPLPDMRVAISNHANWKLAVEPVTSGPDGRFTFYGLEAGLYTADTWLQGEIIHYRELPGSIGATRVGPDYKNAEFTFRVAFHPSIEGTVRDELGDPVPHVNVGAFRAVWQDSRIVPTREAAATTDDRGHYRISALPPGAYVVCTELVDGYNILWSRTLAPESASTVDFGARDGPRFHGRSCYPGEPQASFKIDWGHDAQVDLKLSLTSGTKIQGRVTNGGPHTTSINLLAEDETVTAGDAQLQPDGTFEANILEPGRYLLEARAGAAVTQQIVVADKTPVTGLQLTMQPSATISVFVQGPASPAPQPDSVSVGLRSASFARGFARWAQRASDGSLSLPAIEPGKYWVLAHTEAPFCVESVTFGGRAVLHDTLTVASGDSGRLDIMLSTQCARIDGRVPVPEPGEPYPIVVVMMSGTAKSPGDVITVNFSDQYTGAAELKPEVDGAFFVDCLPPGRYLLWALKQSDLGDRGPASLADVANQASVVEVGKGRHAQVQLKVLSGRDGVR